MKRYAVFPIGKILQDQAFVFCSAQDTAQAVAKRFHDDPDSVTKYTWKTGWEHKNADQYGVVELKAWAVVPAWAVRPDEFFLGVWSPSVGQFVDAREIATDLSTGKTSPCRYVNGRGPTLGRGYAIVRRDLPALIRGDLKPGDCFVYLDDPDNNARYIVTDRTTGLRGMPKTWVTSNDASALLRLQAPVFCIPRWDYVDDEDAAPAKPALDNTSFIKGAEDPFHALRDRIFVESVKTVDGLRGEACLKRFEQAQQTESIAWTGTAYVSTNADCGLTATQVAHAQYLWTLVLRLRVHEKTAEAAARDRMQVTCDPVDEL